MSFLGNFAERIRRDVNDIISNIDGGTVAFEDLRTKDQPQNSSANNSFRKRWERILKREEDRHLSRNRFKESRRAKLSIEDLWDESLRRYGYCVALKSDGIDSSVNGTKVADDQQSMINERDESLGAVHRHLSPIFRFPVHEQLCLEDLERWISKESIEDSEVPLYDDRIEIKHLLSDSSITEEKMIKEGADSYLNSILRSISLLIAMKPQDWRQFDPDVPTDDELQMEIDEATSDHDVFDEETRAQCEVINDETNITETQNNLAEVRLFLHHVTKQKYGLTTLLANLLLARLVTSTDLKNREIGDACLRIFEEMKLLAESGQRKCEPDFITYRLLILAFSRRLQGMGEAIDIIQKMVDNPSTHISPELLNDALMACHAKTEISVAASLMNTALSHHRVRMNVGSCILYTEMLKTQKLDQEAIDFFNRIQEARILNQYDEDLYLKSLCQWPKRSRRGDVLDLSAFWTKLLFILEQRTKSSEKPDIRVWITFLQGLHDSARNDDSLWNIVRGATRTILESYPRNFLGAKLMTIGLEASSSVEDTELASMILKRVANEPRNPDTKLNRPAIVPFRALKGSLEICLQTSDAESARSIRESLEQIDDPYPIGAKSELHSLVLLCHAKSNDAENAKRDLEMMINSGLKPSEELYSAVLHTMAVTGRYAEMEELFQSMKRASGNQTKPEVSSYDAIMLARIRAGSWDEAIAVFEQMKAEDVTPSARTIQGLLVATNQKGGRPAVTSALESLLQCDAQFDEMAFSIATKTLFEGLDGDLDEFRKTIRDIGEQNQSLRTPSLNLARSVRSAQIEESRPKTAHKLGHEMKRRQTETWQTAISHLLEFVRVWSGSEGTP
eukprot:jgi/Psemu1/235202/estExt_Genewise1.C_260079